MDRKKIVEKAARLLPKMYEYVSPKKLEEVDVAVRTILNNIDNKKLKKSKEYKLVREYFDLKKEMHTIIKELETQYPTTIPPAFNPLNPLMVPKNLPIHNPFQVKTEAPRNNSLLSSKKHKAVFIDDKGNRREAAIDYTTNDIIIAEFGTFGNMVDFLLERTASGANEDEKDILKIISKYLGSVMPILDSINNLLLTGSR